ncbi:AmmeMemoRadiSam system radical SAM enzyme [bacterium]|nr:MAG: AmmeMemoRadiSam system radical SAM enzyme [bacterium]
MKETILYEKLKDGRVKCNTCNHRCIIKDGEHGICGVRKDENGKLISLVYGKVAAINVDPIEKKPFFHFLPGSYAFSFGTFGCNFACAFCQNWTLSQPPKENFFWHDVNIGADWLPVKIVSEALKRDCQSIAYTYNEPTVFLEYALDTMKIAREAGLKNVWVSNGYMTAEALDLISPYLDACNIDLKSFSENFYNRLCGGKLEPVLENIKRIKKAGIWLELTTLLIPDENDKVAELKKIAEFIFNKIGAETPWHISRFYPAYKMKESPATDIRSIEKAIKIGKQAGLKYVYAGNVPGSSYENTYCPRCNGIIVERANYIIRRFDKDGACPRCKTKIDLILE